MRAVMGSVPLNLTMSSRTPWNACCSFSVPWVVIVFYSCPGFIDFPILHIYEKYEKLIS